MRLTHEQLPSGQSSGSLRVVEQMLELIPAGAYTCDPSGLITAYNQRAVDLWGRRPTLNHASDRYCGSWKLFSMLGATINHDQCWMALALHHRLGYNEREIIVERPDGERRVALAHANPLHDDAGELIGALNILVDITSRKLAEEKIRQLNEALEAEVQARTQQLQDTGHQLEHALHESKTLRGLIPICAWCKKIRNEEQAWQQLEVYLREHTEAAFSHTICPGCSARQLGTTGL